MSSIKIVKENIHVKKNDEKDKKYISFIIGNKYFYINRRNGKRNHNNHIL